MRSAPERQQTRGRAKKISITVDEAVLREVEKQARRSGRSLSAQVTEALARDLRQSRLRQLIEEYETEHGSISESELASIRDQWQG
jgi:hypothetical protein